VPRPDAAPGRTGRPPVTSRAQILVAARRLIDRDGWDRLTIRRLGAELGIGPTTLYHHVKDKEDLLVLLLTEYAEQIGPLELPEDPRERIVAGAIAMRDGLAGWPWAAEALAADGFIRLLGGSALTVVEAIVAGAVDAGCTPEQAADVFRSIWYYTVGEILVRVRSARRRGDAGHPAGDAFFAHLDGTQMPHLTAIGDRWPALAARDTYPQGVRALVDGLLRQAGPPGP
jgi:AcrR family transcriptional regulator